MKTAARGGAGRPRLPPDQRRDKPLYVLLTKGEHQGLVEVAKRNARTLSEEVVRRLHATLQWPDWEDSIGLLASSSRIARRVLLEQGWKQWDDPRHGSVLLAPGSTAPPGGAAVADVEAAQPRPCMVEEQVAEMLHGLILDETLSIDVRARISQAVEDASQEVTLALLRNHNIPPDVRARIEQAIEDALKADTKRRSERGLFPGEIEIFEVKKRLHNAKVAPQVRDFAVQARQHIEERMGAGGEEPEQEERVVQLLEASNADLQDSVREGRAEALFPQAKTRHEQDTGERRKRHAAGGRRRAAKPRSKAGGKVA
jgi:hypothetical protein